MKIVIFSESANDEAAIKILVASILEEKIEEIPFPNHLRSRGSGVLRDVSPVLRAVYYNTEAEFLVIVRDSDDSPIHKEEHNEPNNAEAERCRFCELRKTVKSALDNLTTMLGKEHFRVAIGVAVPAIEAWLLCDKNPHASEATWINQQRQRGLSTYNDRKRLKTELYGSDRVSGSIMTERGTEAAKRLAKNIERLEQLFPEGFGSLAREVRSWKQ